MTPSASAAMPDLRRSHLSLLLLILGVSGYFWVDSSGDFSFSALQRQLGVPETAPKALDLQTNHSTILESEESYEELYDEPVLSEHSGRAITGMSFTTIMTGTRNKHSSDYIAKHQQFLRTKACWFQRHGYPYVVSVFHQSERPTYDKPIHVEKIFKITPQWLFFFDMDIAILRPDVSPTSWLDDASDIIVNDHNAAMNNGAFMLRNGEDSIAYEFIQRWYRLGEGQDAPNRKVWPFTDNGSFLEALLAIDPVNRPSRCANQPGPEFLPCYNKLFEEVSGQEFQGNQTRTLHGKVKLAAPITGFNNHECGAPHKSWGWAPGACYHEGQTVALHTKKFPSQHPGGRSATCPAGEKLAGMLKQPGVMVVLPGHDMPCDLEADADCIAKARPFFNLPEATTDGTSAATTTTYEEGGTER